MNYATEIDRAIEDEQIATALTLAEQWVANALKMPLHWSKLAHVHEMTEDFAKAGSAASRALKVSPDWAG